MLTFSYHNLTHVNGAILGQVSVLASSMTPRWEFVGEGTIPTSWESNGYPCILFPDENSDHIDMEFQPRKPYWPWDDVYGNLSLQNYFDKNQDGSIVYNEKAVQHVNFDGWVKLAGTQITEVTERIGYIQRIGTNFRLPVSVHGYDGVNILISPGDAFYDTVGKKVQRWRCSYVESFPRVTTIKLEMPCFAGWTLDNHYVWIIQYGERNGTYGYKWQRKVVTDGGEYYDSITSTPWPTPPYGGTIAPVEFHPRASVPDPSRARQIVTDFIDRLGQLDGFIQMPPELDIYGELATQCTGEYKRIDSNVPSTVKETLGTADEVIDLVQGVKDVFHAKGAARFIQALGNLKLSIQWGLPLTLQDLQSISDTTANDILWGRYKVEPDDVKVARRRMDLSCPCVGSLSHLKADCRWTLKTFVKSSTVGQEQQFARMMADYNVVSLENGWDMLPYSFVVDWLTDFGSIVSGTDTFLYRMAYFEILGSVRGRRLHIHLDSTAVHRLEPLLIGDVDLVLYRRVASHTIPLPTFGFLTPHVGLDQWIDGAILIGQQLIS